MRRFAMSGLLAGLVASGALGCRSAPPPRELVDARTAYQRAVSGPPAKVDPEVLHDARTALAAAERAYAEEGDSPIARDLGYIALRRAQLAEVVAQERQIQEQVELTSAEIERRNEQALEQEQQRLIEEERALVEERQRHQAAEQRAQQAASALANIAIVKQDPRGLVITLSGGALFPQGKATLLPTARGRLNRVAEAIKPDSTHTIIIEGYTDSTGNPSASERLSQERAEAVRDYLISRGAPADRITAKGMGEANPVADNSTAEGRANNRRIEIIIEQPRGQQRQPQQQQQEQEQNLPSQPR